MSTLREQSEKRKENRRDLYIRLTNEGKSGDEARCACIAVYPFPDTHGDPDAKQIVKLEKDAMRRFFCNRRPGAVRVRTDAQREADRRYDAKPKRQAAHNERQRAARATGGPQASEARYRSKKHELS